MRQAIVTKYLGPTNIKGARIKATCDAKTIIHDWNHALNTEWNHRQAATKLAIDLGWLEKNGLAGGALPKNAGYCFVLVEED
jgi:hypothetical protein